jgi:DNA-binding response OmpR family regulator
LCEERLIFSPKELSLKDKVFIIVEDEEEILENLRDLLQEEGAKVYTFTSGKALLSSWDNLEKPHLLIIDLNLPDIGGREIAISLKEKDPSLKILFITGDIFALSEFPEEKILLKPFKIEELFEKIKKNLNE